MQVHGLFPSESDGFAPRAVLCLASIGAVEGTSEDENGLFGHAALQCNAMQCNAPLYAFPSLRHYFPPNPPLNASRTSIAAAEGYAYYHNAVTGISTWERPAELGPSPGHSPASALTLTQTPTPTSAAYAAASGPDTGRQQVHG